MGKKKFGEEVETYEDQCNHRENKILAYTISKPFDLIDVYHMLIQNSCELHAAYGLHDIVLGDGANYLVLEI